ncbi:OLC1v1003308C1 [Oldenlandia corymbosa var. corymbosa]|uniref:OLC1v1003308C1 n=1 Tax=Oldenlandia corymbosa var. corymbosa TaxID=529605 RepID=A0AAV1D9R6_OLDCO|nr:OLC1v1003308C1 [Oldenlandia corymbosa var. corymbosa]
MKTGTKLILLHPSSLHKQGSAAASAAAAAASYRVWLLVFVSFFTLVTLLTLITSKEALSSAAAAAAGNSPGGDKSVKVALPDSVFDALVHYASVNTTAVTNRFSASELGAVAAVLRRCNANKGKKPCNFLVFGLTHETLLWSSLNYNGRTVFVSDNDYFVRRHDERHPEIEAYDVQFTTKVREMYELLAYAKEQLKSDCRPVQNLLFSDCKLAINDFPNYVYDVDWDVILVDGPYGFAPTAPGRMAAIFTAGVFARSKRGGRDKTDVFIHEFDREVERVYSDEFLCRENLVQVVDTLGHFSVGRMDAQRFEFCPNSDSISLQSSSSSSPSYSSKPSSSDN